MRRHLLGLALALALPGCKRTPPPPPARLEPALATAPAGLPPGPESDLVRARCLICHTVQQPLQQRLTEAQWKTELAKMKGWGAPVTDDDAARLVAYFARNFGPDVPDLVPRLVPVPDGGT